MFGHHHRLNKLRKRWYEERSVPKYTVLQPIHSLMFCMLSIVYPRESSRSADEERGVLGGTEGHIGNGRLVGRKMGRSTTTAAYALPPGADCS